ncbi:serine/threonine protein kinase (plasmid) [Aphanizomenon flos-aquae CCAP 1446/1C]|uniref:protein kinase domain-containing protein n=1 Tax=Anabaena sp. PCC 7938 TaxID=1296340 RepID=UPI00202F01AE|nr:protein kinase [Anabaena sp. CCAP 1446/1C]MBY5308702.1 serine/threonine protein kinase [Anabaena sp. CCAP 1446/1C]
MQPPITVSTVLQNRYHIIHVLGQGGFGRTYLAEDQRRFNELCAIKELTIAVKGASSEKKAKELFEREAATLYQIEHPQIPKFREKFEQDQRLFLVQDYVAGKTYHTLLAEHQAVGQSFSETEVLELMNSLLPVLEYIHSCGIIHRDISPDNLILRESDNKPVLIDFGVVKELATRLYAPNQKQVTTVGKMGYSPSEQIQSGRAYPNSDLYALAVTAIVLLTLKEPTDLFDETKVSWNWQQWVTINPRFAEVLQRMLSYVPSDRFQSAAQVQLALQSLDQPHVPQTNISYVQTLAVGNRPQPPSPQKPRPVIYAQQTSPKQTSSILDKPLAIGAIGSAVVILAGFGSWAIVKSFRNQSQQPSEGTSVPQNFPSPVIPDTTFTLSPTPTPTNTQSVVYQKRLKLGRLNTATVEDTLKVNDIIQYSFAAQAGQKLTVSVDQGSGILLTVLTPNGQPIDGQSQPVASYEGILLDSGKYIIQLSLSEGVAESYYSLSVALSTLTTPVETPTPTETPTPEETPTPTPTETPTTDAENNNQLPETTSTPGFDQQN